MSDTRSWQKTAWVIAVVTAAAALPLLARSLAPEVRVGEGLTVVTLLLAVVWGAGGALMWWVSRDLDVHPYRRASTKDRWLVVVGASVGLAVASFAGAWLLLQWEATRPWVADPLGAAKSQGALAIVAVALLAGLGEELYFRVALPRLFGGVARWLVPLLAYAGIVAVTGSVAMIIMSVILGAVATASLELTGWIAAPIAVHAAWTIAMVGIFAAVM